MTWRRTVSPCHSQCVKWMIGVSLIPWGVTVSAWVWEMLIITIIIIIITVFSGKFCYFMDKIPFEEMSLVKWLWGWLMISQHWLGWCPQATSRYWANANPDLCHHVALQGHNELSHFLFGRHISPILKRGMLTHIQLCIPYCWEYSTDWYFVFW